ncbi:hypothetical protein FQN57_004940 [Myotisia sp. PD_48]|nr:hypothetical protein FQN57_004940 [Myotisia sp. PD_48]
MRFLWWTILVVLPLINGVVGAIVPRDWSRSATSTADVAISPSKSPTAARLREPFKVLQPFQNTTFKPVLEVTASLTEAFATTVPVALLDESTNQGSTDVITKVETHTRILSLITNPKSHKGANGRLKIVTKHLCIAPTAGHGSKSHTSHLEGKSLASDNVQSAQSGVVTQTVIETVTTFVSEAGSFPTSTFTTYRSDVAILPLPEPTTTQLRAPTAFRSFDQHTSSWNTTSFAIKLKDEQNETQNSKENQPSGPNSTVAHHLIKRALPQVNRRQVGAIVVVTMDGQEVSWTNQWDGTPKTSKPFATKTYPSHTPTYSVKETKSTSAHAVPTDCGESGNFLLNFDDLPTYAPPNNDTAAYPPIFNPYHHLFFSNGWSYGPPPNEPFTPFSKPCIGIFVPSKERGPNGEGFEGEFGAGPRSYNNIYWFDAYSAYVGCSNEHLTKTPCEMTITALRFDLGSNTEIPSASSTFLIPACMGPHNCNLTQIVLGSEFRGLSGLKIKAMEADSRAMWYIDDISLKWYDDSCAAGKERQRSRFKY